MNKFEIKRQHTMHLIFKTVGELLLNKESQEITVSEVCNKANIYRSTFYFYFSSIDDVIVAINSMHIEETKKHLYEKFPFVSTAQIITFEQAELVVNYFVDILVNNKDFVPYYLKDLLNNSLFDDFIVNFGEKCLLLNNPSIAESRVFAIGIDYTIKRMLLNWLKGDIKLNKEKIVLIILNLLFAKYPLSI